MYQGRKTQSRPQNAYQRPTDQPHPAWMENMDEQVGKQAAPAYEVWQNEPVYDEPADEAWEGQPFQPSQDACHSRPVREAPSEEIIATNRMVLLTCTLASMLGLFALFLSFEEKKSRAIRWFAVQSAGLAVVHLAVAVALLVIGTVLGAIPFLGFLVTLICWLVYIAVAVLTVCLRVRMMHCAWRGVRFTLPVMGRHLARFC